jgi:hypothetical protein
MLGSPEPPPGRGSSQLDDTTQALLREEGSSMMVEGRSSVVGLTGASLPEGGWRERSN